MVKAFPADPLLSLDENGELTNESLVNLGLWVRDVERYHKDIRACPLVKEVP